MKFYIPTELYIETGCVKTYGQKLAGLGSHALIVTGKNSARKTGALQDVIDVLDKYGTAYTLFDETEENPSVETVERAAKTGIEKGADFVIGIGGGSPLDAGKAISLLIKNPGKTGEDLYKPKPLSGVPFAAVPTTAGTGSEATPYAILTLHKNRTKKSMSQRVFPVLGLNDYTYLSYAGKELLLNTAVDTLAHLMESYLNANANSVNRMFSERGLMVWRRVKEKLLDPDRHPFDDGDYQNLSEASALGGMAIAHTATSFPHALGYSLTYEQGIPHGKATGIFLPPFIEMYEDQEQVKAVLELLDFKDIEAFADYLKQALGGFTAEGSELEANIDEQLSNPTKTVNYPFQPDKEKFYTYCCKYLEVKE